MKYVALLRGINVGGHRKFPKANQLELLQNCKLNTPAVYLHTGNWVFESSKNKTELESLLLKSMEDMLGWNVPILLKSAKEINSIISDCPFPEEKKKRSYFVLPFTKPLENVEEINKISFPNEEFYIKFDCIYLYVDLGMSKAKLSNNWFENKLKITATARNYNTMKAIQKLLDS